MHYLTYSNEEAQSIISSVVRSSPPLNFTSLRLPPPFEQLPSFFRRRYLCIAIPARRLLRLAKNIPDLRDDVVEHWCCQSVAVQEGKEHVQDLFGDIKGFALQQRRVGGKLVGEGGLNFPVEGLGLCGYFPQLFGGYVEGEEGFWKMLF